VTVTRGTSFDRYEIYTSTLEKCLPRFRLPVTPGDPDGIVDLQAAFRRTYLDAGFGVEIDYRNNPTVPLSAEVVDRVAEILRERRG
jgi:hypothetical protein